jgi:hypothetical protein
MIKKVATTYGPQPSRTGVTPVPPAKAFELARPIVHSKEKPLSQQEIRVRAYQKWEAAGKPRGNDLKFWLEAEQELLRSK